MQDDSEEAFLPWPQCFEIHNEDIRRDVREELRRGALVTNRIRSAVIQAVYDKMCLYTVYVHFALCMQILLLL